MSAIEAIAIARPTNPTAWIQPGRDSRVLRRPSSRRRSRRSLARNTLIASMLMGSGKGPPPFGYSSPRAVRHLRGSRGLRKIHPARPGRPTGGLGGRDVLETREPGGTPSARSCAPSSWIPGTRFSTRVTEWLLIEAARRQHVREVLKPGSRGGRFILCDRFSDSTEAYQQVGRGLDPTAAHSSTPWRGTA